MGSLAKLSLRPSVAFRLATCTDFPRIVYTVSLGAWREPGDLSKRGRRVLRWFAALNRCGEFGYTGFRAPLGAAADSCGRATGEASSRSTFCRGLRELTRAGYIENGTFRGGAPREYSPGEFARDPIAVYTITDRGLAVWASSRRAAKGRTIPHLCVPVSICDGDVLPEIPDLLSGNPARVSSSSSSVSSGRSDAETPVKRASYLDPDAGRGGRSKARTKVARSAGRPVSRAIACGAILATLRYCVKWRGRPGQAALARCALELADPQAASVSPVAWDHWIAHWGRMTRNERIHVARAEILAVLEPSHFTRPVINPIKKTDDFPTGIPLGKSSPVIRTSGSLGVEDLPNNHASCDARAALLAAAESGNEFARAYLDRQNETKN